MIFICVSLVGFLAWLIGHRKLIVENIYLRRKNKLLIYQISKASADHQRVFQEMISRVHHQGIVPVSASAVGLIYVISLEVSRCILSLKKLQEQQDWRTHTVSTELLRLMNTELSILELKLMELNTEVKRVVNEYNLYQ